VPDDLTELPARLADLGKQLAEWNSNVNRHFQSLWSFNTAPNGGFEQSLTDAAAIAEERAGPGPRQAGYELLAKACDAYAAAPGESRSALRDVVGASQDLGVLCLWFAGWALQRLDATASPEWLRRAVTAAVLSDTAPDYRDWYLTLGDVWITAVNRGLDPRPVFAEVAATASVQAEPGTKPGAIPAKDSGGWSTQEMLAGFEQSAYFAESVVPALRGKDL
jgi:hypothetical protein